MRTLFLLLLLAAAAVLAGGSAAAVPGAWVQVGADIDGEAAGDLSGSSVALSADGARLAVGAPFNDGIGASGGHVRVFDWSGTAWVQVGADIDGEAAGDIFGSTVALSSDGSRLVVGAWFNDGGGDTSGHVRVFDWSGAAWVQVGADIDGEAALDSLGFSVALSSDGSRLAAGAPFNDGGGDTSGHVRVFDWSGAAWVQVGADIDGEAAGDTSGFSVTLNADGSRLAIGATDNDGNGTDAGHVRVFDWSGAAWVQVGADIDGEAAGDDSGYSVAFNGDGSRVAVGARDTDSSGYVRVFDWSGAAWVQAGADIDGEAAGDWSGVSVALSTDGSRLAVGASRNQGDSSPESGHVRVFDWSGAAWVQAGADIDGEAAGDWSGRALALSADGSRAAVGARKNDGNGADAGHVRVFEFDMPEPLLCNSKVVTVDLSRGEAPTEGADVILGTEEADTIDALGGNDVVCGLGGDDVINGGDGKDTLQGDAGDDTLDGGDGNDKLVGGDGNDTLLGQGGRDIIQGGNGNDIAEGGKKNDRISGNGGRDTLTGGNGKDRIDGQAGPDTIVGGGGNDRLIGGGGVDTINGKVGDDFCIEGETVLLCEFDFIP